MPIRIQATVEDLYRVPENGKAELVNGELVLMSPTGDVPSRVAFEIAISLHAYASRTGVGLVYPDNAGFLVNLPFRKSFSPDAAYYIGPGGGLKFLMGAPIFAVEVRSEGDFGRAAEQEMAEKRRDYFTAGTKVVWDVDMLLEKVVRVYRASDPYNPTVYRRGDTAEAEPAVPGWMMSVEELFVPGV